MNEARINHQTQSKRQFLRYILTHISFKPLKDTCVGCI